MADMQRLCGPAARRREDMFWSPITDATLVLDAGRMTIRFAQVEKSILAPYKFLGWHVASARRAS